MPSLSFDSENGKAVAYIQVSKEELKAKPELKTYNNQIIYLHDNSDGVKEIEFDDLSIFPLFKFRKGEKQINRISVYGRSGVGKSSLVGKILDSMKSKRFGDPDREIFIISGIDEDEALDKPRGPKDNKELPERVDVYDPSFAEMKPADFKGGIVIYDDVEAMANKAVSKAVLNLRNTMFETSRHFGTDIISISHNTLGGNLTRYANSESTGFVLFPGFSQHHHIQTYLKKYGGFSKDAIEKVVKIGETRSRWIYCSNMSPSYVVHEHGCYLVK